MRLCAALWLFLFSAARLTAAEERLEVLDVGGVVYSNVTVTSKSATHIFIQHSRGFAGLKIEELSNSALAQLGYARLEKPRSLSLPSSNRAAPLLRNLGLKLPNLDPKITETAENVTLEVNHRSVTVEKQLLKGILACVAAAYMIFCLTATAICRKSCMKPGIWCWIPLAQVVCLLRAARLPGVWVVLWFLPIFTLPISILWCVKICRVHNKGFLTMFFLMLPVTTPLAFFYLAIAKDENQGVPTNKVRLAFKEAA